MKTKISKKEIRNTIEISMNEALNKLQISAPSGRIKKMIKKTLKEISNEVKQELIEKNRKDAKAKEALTKK